MVGALVAFPSEAFECSAYTALICGSDAWCFHEERLACDAEDGNWLTLGMALSLFEPFADGLFPGVGFVASVLLGLDVLCLERLVGPPLCALSVEMDGFGEELVTVADEGLDVDLPCVDGPEPAPAGFVAEVDGLVCCSDKAHWRGPTTSSGRKMVYIVLRNG